MKTAAIFGSNKGIGRALLENLLSDPSYKKVFGSCRKPNHLQSLKEQYKDKFEIIHYDPNLDSSIDNIKREFNKINRLDLCINCIGTLLDPNTKPERQVSEVASSSLEWAFKINTIPSITIAKEIKTLFRNTELPIFAALSAKVGSISDNAMGGWYSYRISKAALNMAIKNTAIEFNRINKKGLVVALHPGTTKTDLSAPFLENAAKKYTIHEPVSTAENILTVLFKLNPKNDNGELFSWDSSKIKP